MVTTDGNDGTVLYARQDQLYVLRFVGDIRCSMGCSLDKFLQRLLAQNDFDSILIDLTETTAIDSTNLGLLAKVANRMWNRSDEKVTLLSTNPDIDRILEGVGFDQVFQICHDQADYAAVVERLKIENPSKAEMLKTVLDAHSVLSGLNDKNRQAFKSVVEFLESKTTPEQ